MRLLKTLVIAMGLILVVAFGALVIIVMDRMNAPKPAPAASVAVAPQATPAPAPLPAATPALPPSPLPGQSLPQHFTPSFGEQTLVLPPGARISDFSAGGDRLVLRVIMSDQTQQLVVVDLNTGAMIGTLNVENSGQPAPTSVLPTVPNVNVPPRNAQEGKK